MVMRRLLWILLTAVVILFAIVMPLRAFAQGAPSFGAGDLKLSMLAPAPGDSEVATVSFTSLAAVNGATLDIEIYDPSGTRVAQSWQTGVIFTAGQTVPANPLVWTVPQGAVPGIYTVKLGVWDGSNAIQLWIDQANVFTVTGAAAAPAQTAKAAACLPKLHHIPWSVSYGKMPAGVSVRYDHFGAWLCEKPYGYIVQVYQLSLTAEIEDAILHFVALAMTPEDAAAMILAHTDTAQLTATEQAFTDALIAAVQPVIRVAFNAGSPTRPVFSANADGTLNQTPVAGELVAVDDSCNPAARVPGTQYFGVAGRPNVNGGTLPAGSFAACMISRFPYGVN